MSVEVSDKLIQSTLHAVSLSFLFAHENWNQTTYHLSLSRSVHYRLEGDKTKTQDNTRTVNLWLLAVGKFFFGRIFLKTSVFPPCVENEFLRPVQLHLNFVQNLVSRLFCCTQVLFLVAMYKLQAKQNKLQQFCMKVCFVFPCFWSPKESEMMINILRTELINILRTFNS